MRKRISATVGESMIKSRSGWWSNRSRRGDWTSERMDHGERMGNIRESMTNKSSK
jgi:hypothetical protein